jgi:DNA gyrase subunit A
MGVKFVTFKSGDSVAVVTRSVEAQEEAVLGDVDGEPEAAAEGEVVTGEVVDESAGVVEDATIDGDDATDES